MNYQSLSKKYVEDSSRKLNILLASHHIHYQNLRNFHWTVKGPNFFELHAKFEKMYEAVSSNVDAMAERILALNSQPITKLSEYIIISEVEEADDKLETRQMVIKVLEDLDTLIKSLKFLISFSNVHQDDATADMLTAFVLAYEKDAWMFKAYLKNEKEMVRSSQ